MILVYLLLFVVPYVKSLSFAYPSFDANMHGIFYEKDSSAIGGQIQLTKNQLDSSIMHSVGRASYDTAIPLWDRTTKELASFTTHFAFQITQLSGDSFNNFGDGMAFFLAPFDSRLPVNSTGGCLGLVGSSNNLCTDPSNSSQIVAVEFDNFHNVWDPQGFVNHIGIDVDSVVSVETVEWGDENATTANAWITYNSSTKNLSVFLTYDEDPVFAGDSNSTLSYVIDLSTVLPENVRVGFSAATGRTYQLSSILSWEFNSTLLMAKQAPAAAAAAPQPREVNTSSPPSKGLVVVSKKKKGLVVGGVVTGVGVLLIALLSLVGFMWWRRKSSTKSDDMGSELSDGFESGTGPRRFTYGELSRATNDYDEERKLGEGGFGGVYLGVLVDPNPNREIAVKKVSRGSRQGKKEYVSEVKIISRLRHKNLVQLLGWCHEQGELILVYEYLPNGSLDYHLYGGRKDPIIPWAVRYKIAIDLALALVYLHEEWEQCVLHRDIKSSNVMLDSNFNAKLGDFGLARLVDHDMGAQTTVLAGTLGYLAPECATTGKASKESDVYSFGVVALEIGCGRRPIEPSEEPSKVMMIEWVWDLYGRGLLHEAIDKRVEAEYDVQQTECLMVVGLWCCHPHPTLRPSISQVIKVLKSEAPLPNLPSTFPVPIYPSIPMRMDTITYSIPSSTRFSSSSGATGSSSQSRDSGAAPLLSGKANV